MLCRSLISLIALLLLSPVCTSLGLEYIFLVPKIASITCFWIIKSVWNIFAIKLEINKYYDFNITSSWEIGLLQWKKPWIKLDLILNITLEINVYLEVNVHLEINWGSNPGFSNIPS